MLVAVAFAPVEVTWSVCQNTIPTYQSKDRAAGRWPLSSLIPLIKTRVPKVLVEVAQLSWTLRKGSDDILAFFDHPVISNGPTEAIKCGTARDSVEPARHSDVGWQGRAVMTDMESSMNTAVQDFKGPASVGQVTSSDS